MKYYTPQHKQLTLDLVRSSLDNLDKSNRWVQMGDLLPWADIEKEYNSRLDNKEKGAGNKPARMVVGAMIVKHKLGLSDQETIDIIRENPYMQYLCGLSEFTDTPIFDSSLFVTIRKRISEEEINAMTTKMLLKQQRILEDRLRQKEQESRDKGEEPPKPKAGDPDAAEFTDTKGRKHKGVLKIDATCAGECHKSKISWADNPTYVPTSITTAKTADSTDDSIYDMQGRRVSTPVKGLYIKNNKKVFIK